MPDTLLIHSPFLIVPIIGSYHVGALFDIIDIIGLNFLFFPISDTLSVFLFVSKVSFKYLSWNEGNFATSMFHIIFEVALVGVVGSAELSISAFDSFNETTIIY